jgi:L-fuculose-phosphate aldolase
MNTKNRCVKGFEADSVFAPDHILMKKIVTYSKYVTSRGYVCNQLGNIAIKTTELVSGSPVEVVYTKCGGISLEEMEKTDISIMSLNTDQLISGTRRPSLGHALSREIFRCRNDVNAVIHLHIDILISYFAMFPTETFRYISADAPLIMQAPICILAPGVNIESDVSLVPSLISNTNVIIMPNHGITACGPDISTAYHRVNTLVAEVTRIYGAMQIANITGKAVPFLNDETVCDLYELSKTIFKENQE